MCILCRLIIIIDMYRLYNINSSPKALGCIDKSVFEWGSLLTCVIGFYSIEFLFLRNQFWKTCDYSVKFWFRTILTVVFYSVLLNLAIHLDFNETVTPTRIVQVDEIYWSFPMLLKTLKYAAFLNLLLLFLMTASTLHLFLTWIQSFIL